ncbi:Type VI secretion protein [Pseudomonas syringae pv. cerasicola]|nr:Type VI secretion protein [Pseudomonas syringae pv. cerasicola]RMS78565.1 Type VI secretion protein [Pseudomonas savastanoi]RMT45332.1 Type VI secretion protein [Pseudomonas savastanoi]
MLAQEMTMAKKESTQHKLDRVRAPRVHITYDVDIGDAQ